MINIKKIEKKIYNQLWKQIGNSGEKLMYDQYLSISSTSFFNINQFYTNFHFNLLERKKGSKFAKK
jgi:hypothetical protein